MVEHLICVRVAVCEVPSLVGFEVACERQLVVVTTVTGAVSFVVCLGIADICAATLPAESAVLLLLRHKDLHPVVEQTVRLRVVNEVKRVLAFCLGFYLEKEPLDEALCVCIVLQD